MSKTPCELVFVPIPAMGHIVSAVQLAKLILNLNDLISVSIYIINFPLSNSKVDDFIDSQLRDNPYPTRLTFVTLPPLPNPPDLSNPKNSSAIVDLQKPLIKQAVEDRVRAGLPKPAALVLDMLCSRMVGVADELRVPAYLYYASGANILNFSFFAQMFADDHPDIDVYHEFSRPEFSALVPGFRNPVTTAVIPAVMHEKYACEMFLDFTRTFRKMKGILINTYVELEPFGVQALMNSDGEKIPPIYPVGPILELGDAGSGGSVNNFKDVSVIQWLDGQPKSSVVFLCFGSIMGCFDEKQVKEIAMGLERSGHRYLWALRKPPSPGKIGNPGECEGFLEALPEGFIDRTSDRGKIIEWAPQVEVLAHPAVGGFVSHCGWNSMLESVWFGVPIATWPIYSEQQLNAFVLVKELELAVEIRMDYKRDIRTNEASFLVKADEIEKGIMKLMDMDEAIRERVKKMSDEGKKALDEGGSSYNYLKRFIEDVLRNVG